MAKARASLGVTLNMGNYESLRVEVGYEDDAREGEDDLAAMTRVYDFVDKYLEDKISEAKKSL